MKRKKHESGSAIIMGLILLCVFAILASGVYRLSRETLTATTGKIRQNYSSTIAESVLNKIKYDMYDKFQLYYISAPDARSTKKLDWFTRTTETSRTIGNPADQDSLFTIPSPSEDIADYFSSVPEDWNGCRFDTKIEWLDDNGVNCHYKITVSAYYLDADGNKDPDTERIIEEVTEFGYGESEAFDYLIYVGTDYNFEGSGYYFGDVKSDGDMNFGELKTSSGRKVKPVVNGSAFAGGEITGTRYNGAPQKTVNKFFKKWSNDQYRRWATWGSGGAYSASRPFKPSVRFNSTSVSNSPYGGTRTVIWYRAENGSAEGTL